MLQNAQGVYSAREIVGWYNGLPEFAAVSLVSNDLFVLLFNRLQDMNYSAVSFRF